ncbi:MAG: serine hydrolase [Roseomonas mucosa]|nr:serine hydrolase [Roseomonas mucosa]
MPKLHTLIVAQEGRTLLEEGLRGPGPDRPVNVKSVSKSVLSLLVGAALARGVLRGLDQPVAPVLGGLVPAEADPRVRDITLEHLLSMRAGLERTSGENYGAFASSRNWVRHILSRPFEEEPGGAMRYSTGDTHLLSAVLTRASGRSTLDLARDWLGGPLDIAIPPWPRDPQGIYFENGSRIPGHPAPVRPGAASSTASAGGSGRPVRRATSSPGAMAASSSSCCRNSPRPW